VVSCYDSTEWPVVPNHRNPPERAAVSRPSEWRILGSRRCWSI